MGSPHVLEWGSSRSASTRRQITRPDPVVGGTLSGLHAAPQRSNTDAPT
jgi:hypothetical protein